MFAIVKRMHPSGRGGHPYGLKDIAKWHEGCSHPAVADTHRASWLQASRHKDLPFDLEASSHAARWAQASGREEAPFRGLRTPMGPHGPKKTTRRMHRSGERRAAIGSHRRRQGTGRRTASRVARGHVPSSTRGSARGHQRSTKRAAALGLFDTVIDGRGVLERPDARLASRAEHRDAP
jgi:hypothetical protein